MNNVDSAEVMAIVIEIVEVSNRRIHEAEQYSSEEFRSTLGFMLGLIGGIFIGAGIIAFITGM